MVMGTGCRGGGSRLCILFPWLDFLTVNSGNRGYLTDSDFRNGQLALAILLALLLIGLAAGFSFFVAGLRLAGFAGLALIALLLSGLVAGFRLAGFAGLAFIALLLSGFVAGFCLAGLVGAVAFQ